MNGEGGKKSSGETLRHRRPCEYYCNEVLRTVSPFISYHKYKQFPGISTIECLEYQAF